MLYSLSQQLVLVVALSIDLFVASISYGSNKIKVSFINAVIINIICCFNLGLALLLGNVINNTISEGTTKAISFLLLFFLGIIKLLDSSIKSYISRHKDMCKNIKFSFSQLNFIINIYGNPVEADKDLSSSLSCVEAIFLAIAMSIDGMIGGIGVAFLDINVLSTIIMLFAVGLGCVLLGGKIGNAINEKFDLDVSWVSGILFLILAFTKL